MSNYLHNATKVSRVRIRQPDEDNFLLYHPVTDELHKVSRAGEDIFEMCDGGSIDDLAIDEAPCFRTIRQQVKMQSSAGRCTEFSLRLAKAPAGRTDLSDVTASRRFRPTPRVIRQSRTMSG